MPTTETPPLAAPTPRASRSRRSRSRLAVLAGAVATGALAAALAPAPQAGAVEAGQDARAAPPVRLFVTNTSGYDAQLTYDRAEHGWARTPDILAVLPADSPRTVHRWDLKEDTGGNIGHINYTLRNIFGNNKGTVVIRFQTTPEGLITRVQCDVVNVPFGVGCRAGMDTVTITS